MNFYLDLIKNSILPKKLIRFIVLIACYEGELFGCPSFTSHCVKREIRRMTKASCLKEALSEQGLKQCFQTVRGPARASGTLNDKEASVVDRLRSQRGPLKKELPTRQPAWVNLRIPLSVFKEVYTRTGICLQFGCVVVVIFKKMLTYFKG